MLADKDRNVKNGFNVLQTSQVFCSWSPVTNTIRLEIKTHLFWCLLYIFQVILEDRRTNRVVESRSVFETIVNNRAFSNVSIILFMNKNDLLQEKVPKSDIRQYFTDFTGDHTLVSLYYWEKTCLTIEKCILYQAILKGKSYLVKIRGVLHSRHVSGIGIHVLRKSFFLYSFFHWNCEGTVGNVVFYSRPFQISKNFNN